jgi:PTS system mannose-specific IIB component
MGKSYIRVDDRLIHGQTLVAWCPTLGIGEIIGIDDESAKNPTLRSIMLMSVPSRYKSHIVTTAEANGLLKEKIGHNRLVIVKSVDRLPLIAENLEGAEITLGNISKKSDSVYNLKGATGIFYFSEGDVTIIDSLRARGFEINLQQLPNTAKTSWDAFRKSMKLL